MPDLVAEGAAVVRLVTTNAMDVFYEPSQHRELDENYIPKFEHPVIIKSDHVACI